MVVQMPFSSRMAFLTSYLLIWQVTDETHFMKVKNDHRSKFSNLSNWKEEA